ncbi:MAG: flagellar hook-basal body complex protein FliE [Lachnospiraceae bacterium]|nr:flagellar hook-basal body complex protein FliE [Lachnospiraceae bacterium]
MEISSVFNQASILESLKDGKSGKVAAASDNTSTFEALLNSAKGLVNETEEYTNAAEKAELEYMLGLNDNVTDLLIAQTKANVSLQYTVAVKNSVLDAYKEIMNLQF